MGARINHRVVDSVEEKLCPKCKKWYSLIGFYKHNGALDGLNGWCKRCTYEKGKAIRLANPEKVKAYQKKFYTVHPGKRKAYNAKWKEKNPGAY